MIVVPDELPTIASCAVAATVRRASVPCLSGGAAFRLLARQLLGNRGSRFPHHPCLEEILVVILLAK